MEPNDAARVFHPFWPTLEALFERLTDRSRDDVPDRAVAASLRRLAPDFGLQCRACRSISVPLPATAEGGRFWAFLDALLALSEIAFEEPYVYAGLRGEIAARRSDPLAYGQFAATQAVVRKVN